MAKKFVRGITDVKTITNQDFDTNNVNDLLSDGQYNYIHRKKGKTEEYHNLTDNIKTISSDNTELLSVTNYNKTTNTALLSPKHDKQKEQVLESTRDTIAIRHATNGTAEKTTVDTNPQKVLEHENLISDSEYITLDHQTDVNKTHIKTESLKQELQQLHQTKQDTLVAGDGITIEGQTISATAGGAPVEGATSAFKFFIQQDEGVFFEVYKHTITQPYTMGATSGRLTFTTYTFDGEGAEIVLTGELKEELEPHFNNNISISNGGLSITYDGTNIKLINSKPTEDDIQQATFTFLRFIPDGGGDMPV